MFIGDVVKGTHTKGDYGVIIKTNTIAWICTYKLDDEGNLFYLSEGGHDMYENTIFDSVYYEKGENITSIEVISNVFDLNIFRKIHAEVKEFHDICKQECAELRAAGYNY